MKLLWFQPSLIIKSFLLYWLLGKNWQLDLASEQLLYLTIVQANRFERNEDIRCDLKKPTLTQEITLFVAKSKLSKHTNTSVLILLDNSEELRRLKRFKPFNLVTRFFWFFLCLYTHYSFLHVSYFFYYVISYCSFITLLINFIFCSSNCFSLVLFLQYLYLIT